MELCDRSAKPGNHSFLLLDSYRSVNALAETVTGLFKTELIKRRGPWRSVEQVELATLEWVDWWNHRRLHTALVGVQRSVKPSTIKITSSRSWPQPHKPDFTEPSAIQQLLADHLRHHDPSFGHARLSPMSLLTRHRSGVTYVVNLNICANPGLTQGDCAGRPGGPMSPDGSGGLARAHAR